MLRSRIRHRHQSPRQHSASIPRPAAVNAHTGERGSSLLEFAIVLPLLVVLTVGIYDFSNAFNTRQKIAQAAQEGAIVAGAQPMSDIVSTNVNPDSLQPVVIAVFNSLAAAGILPNANQGTGCQMPPPAPTQPAPLTWQYTISGCSNIPGSTDQLLITINRGLVSGGPPAAVATSVQITYPYHWRFASVIQLLFPQSTGPNSYSTPTQLRESATVHNQL
jgi:hypothetical protein